MPSAHPVAIDPATARVEVVRRACARSFLPFCHYLFPDYVDGFHLNRLTAELERIESGANKRLIVMAPPRHGKSMTAAELFPAWYLGRNPKRNIIQTGHSDGITLEHSRNSRIFFSSNEFNRIFPGVSRPMDAETISKQSLGLWRTEDDGSYRAASIRSGIGGFGCDLLIIDDPIRGRADANSSVIRKAILQEFRASFRKRLTPDGAIIMIQTRWHRDDLAGTMLAEMEQGGEQWKVLKFPAIQADGTALHPARWPIERLLAEKMADRNEFEALYQQNPLTQEGGLFQRGWFEIVQSAPEVYRWCRFWDIAATGEGEGEPDWTVGVLIGLSKAGQYFIGDVRRVRATPLQVERLIAQTAAADGHHVMIGMEEEGGASGKSLTSHYARNILTGYDFHPCKPTVSKEERARPFSAAAENGNVKLVSGNWVKAYLDEIEVFPAGDNDDQVDGSSGGFALITQRLRGTAFERVDLRESNPLLGWRSGLRRGQGIM